MFMIKLVLELSALVILTIVAKKVISSTFSLSPKDGPARLRGEFQWYGMLYVVVGVILSITSFWIIYAIFYILHSLGHYSGVMVASQGALVIPAIIIGFTSSLMFTKTIYLNVFGMSDSIFEDDIADTKKRRGGSHIFPLFTVALAMVLLAFQFGVYLKTDGQNIYAKKLGEAEKVYPVSDIEKVTAGNSSGLQIYLANGDQLSTGSYSGNLNYFMDHLSD